MYFFPWIYVTLSKSFLLNTFAYILTLTTHVSEHLFKVVIFSIQSRFSCFFCKSWLQALEALRNLDQLLKKRPRHFASKIFQLRRYQRWPRKPQQGSHATVLSKWERNELSFYTSFSKVGLFSRGWLVRD